MSFTMLLVEDNADDVFLTRAALEDEHVSVNIEVAETGEAAQDRLADDRRPRPDLVLLDLNLPRMHGHALLNWIRSVERLRSLPVCILTTSQSAIDVARAYHVGANAYVCKPFRFAELREVVRQIGGFWFTVVRFPPRESTLPPYPLGSTKTDPTRTQP